MSREKQIEEMGKLCPFHEEGKCNLLEDEAVECNFDCDMCDFAKNLYNAGYRKQSEGEWIRNTQTSEYVCSLCGAISPVDCLKEDFYESNYCPYCGAKMKGDSDIELWTFTVWDDNGLTKSFTKTVKKGGE